MRNTWSRSLGNLEWTLQVYYENGAVNGRPLVLSFELMMRRRATGIDADIMLDSEMLNNVCSGLIMMSYRTLLDLALKDDEINPTEHSTLTGFANHDVSAQHSNARIQGSDLGFNLSGPGSKQHQN
ncbi:hypothetical protein N7507_003479 [Penicillium longicatenatum]|nr:hypothetical protein N7507_003479 [Penicillium longicatenatum]